MAWLDAHARFDPDAYLAPVIGIAATLGNHDSGLHEHQRGQLLFTRQGCTRITLAQQLCLLPPSRAAWIPSGVRHRAVMQQSVDYRSIYLTPALCAGLPQQVCVIEVSPLLRVVLEPIALADFDTDWQQDKFVHLLGLCLSEIREATQQPMLLPLPWDKRLAPLLASLDQLPPELQVLEAQIGASGRTIGRIFQRETGMSYQQWRQQWRLLRAIELLTTGRNIGYSAFELGFASDSAFIAFFKNMTGMTPGAWLK
ncbi:helix-turn-helix transcriptional regulator [Pseudomonas sp. 14P_8.1_Bac3]|uniref:AraC family transcriptional regulator n=1 Tax=Pseudomonas sp. 14P_8.1_Bac3 TaxID=2971621 RepID=UPI0021C91AD8|nr:helix-turn-helix transcriptional regulator [Pseudomonas sp. 14P_8.1_Bac3]MCU1761823.1 helix-turn-helix transcriptional regulator [Pseudomonas sp. 14P_8.1_Bac3]